jgi:outer membrane protein assembly factor BamA
MRIIGLTLLLLTNFYAAAQDVVHIADIVIHGNKKTKDNIILRELQFKTGDSIRTADLPNLLKVSEQMIMNTSLFNQTTIRTEPAPFDSTRLQVKITVEEAWYLYPVPFFELADRNFNVWWVEQKRSLQRVNFGSDFTHTNFTGNADRFKMGAKYGYTQSYFASYSLPYINRRQTLGLSTEISFARNREVNYATDGNKQLFFRDDDAFLYSRFRAEVGMKYRPGTYASHHFNLSYRQNRIADSIATYLNPYFFQAGESLQRYFSFSYQFTFDNRDVRPYPMEGKYISLRLERDGLGFFDDRNALTLFAYFDKYYTLTPRLSMAFKTGGKASLVRIRQPYNDNRAIGFGRNYLHGYDYYVVDGMDMAFVKSNARFRLFENQIKFGKLMPIRQFRAMPMKVFLGFNSDFGYVHEPFDEFSNPLANRLLWGGGLGLDFVFFYDKVLQIEYSVNHLLEKGLFLHVNLNI